MVSGKRILGVIPARLASTRMARKMLAEIQGKTLLEYTFHQVQKAKTLDAIVIATDSKEIADVATAFGATVLMTDTKINSGSDRVAAAASLFTGFTPDIVVNIQGDEPLMPPLAIDDCVRGLIDDTDAVVSTPATLFPAGQAIDSPNFVKVVLDKNSHALYFSRSVIPFPRDPYNTYLKHLGLYAFRSDFLYKYVSLSQTPLELAEKLEQLRILERGYTIKVVVGSYPTLEVNTPEEFEGVKQLIESGHVVN